MKPRILDPSFKYTRAVETDIRKTFARERKRIAEQRKKDEAIQSEAAGKVRKLTNGNSR